MEEKEKFIKFLLKEKDGLNILSEKINNSISELKIKNITQRRQFLQHISLIALGICSITFFTDRIIEVLYLKIGILLLVMTNILILLYLRDVIDKEARELRDLGDKYNISIEEKYNLIIKYLNIDYRVNIIDDYVRELEELPSAKSLLLDIKNESDKRINRKKESLDYSVEVILSLLLLGIFFVFASILPGINIFLLSFIILFIVFLVFSDCIIIKVMSMISKIASLLNKEIKKK